VVPILPGGWHVGRPGERISTVLGSCVAACIRDRLLGLGGMNHFMLPEPREGGVANPSWLLSEPARYGSFAMERLINALIGKGARRERLEVKVFGGARMFDRMGDVGAQNVEFVRRYLDIEGLELAAMEVGGDWGRQVVFDPKSGVALVRRIERVQAREVAQEEERIRHAPAPVVEGSVELWDLPEE
jgi:chemotaxis protein CheD